MRSRILRCTLLLLAFATGLLRAQPVLVETYTADSAVTAVALDRPAKLVAYTSGRTVHVRDRSTGSEYTLEHRGEGTITRLEFSPYPGDLLAVRTVGAPFVWSLDSRAVRYELSFTGARYPVPWAGYMGDAILTVSHDSTYAFWAAKDGRFGHSSSNPVALDAGAVNAREYSLAVGGADGVVRIWQVTHDALTASKQTYSPVRRLAYRTGTDRFLGGPLFVAGTDTIVELDRQWLSARVVYVGSPIHDVVTSILNDRTAILADSSVYILEGGEPITAADVLRAHGVATTTASWNVDGRILATGGTDATVKVWTLAIASAADDAAGDRAITLAPNPASSSVALRLPGARDYRIRIVDALGRVHRTLKRERRTKVELDLRGLASGLYTIVAGDGESSWSERLIVR